MVQEAGRDAPKPCLYVMTPSHYCERARWGLDHKRIPYDERAWAPGIHIAFARRIAKGTSLPILVAGERAIQGSGAVLDWAAFDDGDAALEQRFESVIGVLVRRYIYLGTLQDPRSGIREMLLDGVPPVQAALARAGWPVIRRVMAKSMDIRPELRPEIERRIDAELDWVDTLVADGGALGRGGFGRAQITAASLLAPIAPSDAIPHYRDRTLHRPSDMDQALARWSKRPALRWVVSTYARHRR